MISGTSVDPNRRLYQAPRGIKYAKVQTYLNAIPQERYFNILYYINKVSNIPKIQYPN